MRIAVIPARGGSKRIPRKNIRVFCGRPIIAWSIAAAVDSNCFDRIIVSTDDPEIAATARDFGAETPFERPASIADDFAPTGAVIKHAIDWLADQGTSVEYCCCIYAAAPFVDAADIRSGLSILMESDSDYAVTVTRFPAPVQRACRIRGGLLEMIDPAQYLTRSQDLEEAFHDAGQFYWGRSQAWQEERPIFGNTAPIILPAHRVQDIDTPEDWTRAELMMKYLNPMSGGEQSDL